MTVSQIHLSRGGVDVFDLALDETDGDHLLTDETEETAVLVALLTERRADPGVAPPLDPADPRGWWGETYLDPGQVFGSLLWTLEGRGITDDVIALAEEYTRDALRRWINSGYVLAFEAVSEAPNTLRCKISLTKPGSTITASVPILA